MAVVTVNIGAFDNDAAAFFMEITTPDNLSGHVTGLRSKVAPEAASAVYAEITRVDGSRKASSDYLVGTDTSIGIGTGGAVSIPVTFDATHKRWTGFSGTLLGPTHPNMLKGHSAPNVIKIVNGVVTT